MYFPVMLRNKMCKLFLDRDQIDKHDGEKYDIRHGDDLLIPLTLEKNVRVNYWGTIVSPRPMSLEKDGYSNLSKQERETLVAARMSLEDLREEYEIWNPDIEEGYRIEFSEKGVTIYDDDGEIINWTEDKWLDDPGVIVSINNAIFQVLKNGPKNLRQLIERI